jgi:serpin B
MVKNLKDPTNSNFKDGVVTKIDGYIPEFKYNVDYNLLNVLPKLGIKDVFEQGKADLGNMTSNDGEYIQIAKHSAMIQFDNEGIKAAGVTSMGGAGGAGEPYDYLWDVPVEEIDITFDKPFMYLIRDKANGEVWFMGTVYEPENKQ